ETRTRASRSRGAVLDGRLGLKKHVSKTREDILRRVPHSPLRGFQQPGGDIAERPGVADREERAYALVEGVRLGEPRALTVLDFLGSGAVAEEVVARRRQLGGVAIAVALHRLDPLRVHDPRAEHASGLVAEIPDDRAAGIRRVAEVPPRVAPVHRPDGRDHPAVAL